MDTQKRLESLHNWLDSKPEGTADAIAADLEKAEQLFLEECAARLEKPLNDHVKSMPSKSFEDKLKIVAWVRSRLEPLRLCIGTAKQEPATLIGNHMTSDGCFQFRVLRRHSEPERVAKTMSELPYLSLQPTPLIPRGRGGKTSTERPPENSR